MAVIDADSRTNMDGWAVMDADSRTNMDGCAVLLSWMMTFDVAEGVAEQLGAGAAEYCSTHSTVPSANCTCLYPSGHTRSAVIGAVNTHMPLEAS